jgi:hypothetical protein
MWSADPTEGVDGQGGGKDLRAVVPPILRPGAVVELPAKKEVGTFGYQLEPSPRSAGM